MDRISGACKIQKDQKSKMYTAHRHRQVGEREDFREMRLESVPPSDDAHEVDSGVAAGGGDAGSADGGTS